ncbi:MAG: hypothetical protein SLAVMIC_00383 [uncultured marine phage]|uniref:Uncharacterized protein n=1 Tax=uncultured marine phage TaxID=707152 RepID=A0A8D9C8U5_9VIRU|nr:MAG: hypothetical protein SLAVMIC_00383 [uncultured marine phage]
MSENGKQIFRILMGIVIIGLALVFTVKFIKMLPAFGKIIGIAANIATIYFTVDWIKRKQNKSDNNNNN